MELWPYLWAIRGGLEDAMPAIRAARALEMCPPFRRCKSRKWQRRRNKQFYRIMDGLQREGASSWDSYTIESGWA